MARPSRSSRRIRVAFLSLVVFVTGGASGFFLAESLRDRPFILDSGTESEFVSLINSTRSANGLGSLSGDGGLTASARNHTADMIASGSIYHSSGAELAAAGGSGWDQMGENVGRGQSPTSLHAAFLASPGHAANILGDYNYVGVGTDTGPDGLLYVTVIFMRKTAPEPPPPTTTPTTIIEVAPSTTVVVAPPIVVEPPPVYVAPKEERDPCDCG